MAFQVEYVNDAFPHHCASVRLFDGDGLGQRGATAMLGFDGAQKFGCLNLGHNFQISNAVAAITACLASISSGPHSVFFAISCVISNGLAL